MVGFGFRLWETFNAWHTFTDADTTGCLGGMDISVAIHTLIYLVRVLLSHTHTFTMGLWAIDRFLGNQSLRVAGTRYLIVRQEIQDQMIDRCT